MYFLPSSGGPERARYFIMLECQEAGTLRGSTNPIVHCDAGRLGSLIDLSDPLTLSQPSISTLASRVSQTMSIILSRAYFLELASIRCQGAMTVDVLSTIS